MNDLIIKEIDKKLTYEFIMNLHYAKRKPSISYAYGLFKDDELKAILTIGKPASNSLCIGVCGEEESKRVFELNRLCAKEKLLKNELSYFVSKVLKELKKENLILISYADTGMNHNGYIYQATNWMYTGLTKERTDKYTPGNKHSRHYKDEYKNLRKVRTAKHRYIYLCCDKKTKKELLKKINYKKQEYPKGENGRYVLGEGLKTKILDKEKNIYFYE